jgi:hypothetical protein
MGVEAVVDPRPLTVEALTVTGCEVRVTNTGTTDDEYSFAIDRDAAQWGWVTPPTVSVPAGAQGSVKVLFRLPKAPKPPAGPMPFAITVTSVNDKAVSTVAGGIVDVTPFADFLPTLNPTTAQGTGPSRHTVAISNRGNAPVRARLRVGSDGDGLDLDVEPAILEAAPGTTATADVRVSPRSRLRRGSVSRPFHVVAEVEGTEPVRVEGTVTQEGTGVGRTAVIVAVVAALLVLGGLALALTGGGEAGSTPSASGVPAGSDPACPARGHDNRDRGTSGSLPFNYSFLFTTPDGCRPLRFNPCEPIHYIVNPENAPAGGLDDVRQAFRIISEVGGYTFVDDGVTDTDRFDFNRLPYDPARYGERWAPIVVSWSRLGSQGRNDVVIAGRGNGHVIDGAIVTGMLDLNADARIDTTRETPVPDGFGEGISWGRVMLHELGHVFGLGHVQSRNSIMHEALLDQTLTRTEYGLGDLQAWRLLGKEAGCVETPTPRPAPPLGARAARVGTTTTAG